MGAAGQRIRQDVARGEAFRLTVDGEPLEAYPGETIATALLADNRRTARRTTHRGSPRGVFCAIGVCHDCRMVVDGEANVRTCLVPARAGMVIETQLGFGRASGPASNGDPVTSAIPVHEVVVVGAGPAGIRAAVAARTAGAEVLVLDEAPRPGGQIYRQLPPEIHPAARDRLGSSRSKSRPLFADLARAGVPVLSGAEVWGVLPDRVLLLHHEGRPIVLQAGALVLAAGAYDRPAAMPGWTLPGVVTAGGITALVKAQRVLPGRRVLLAGTGPLLLAAATALVQGGAHVVGIAEAAPRRALLGLLRRPRVMGQTLELMRALWRTPIWPRHGLVRIEGAEGVERAVVARIDAEWRPVGGERTLEVDTVVLGYGLVPSPELADLAGCALAYDAGRGGWIPVADPEELMATSSPGVFVAGDGAGVAGADVAEAQGHLAGLGAAQHVGKLGPRETRRRAAPALRTLRRFAAFRRTLERILAPRPGLYELASDDTIVCRCEEVSAAEIRVAIEEGARHVTEVRAVTRAGMGLCQGRMCVPTVCGLLGRWADLSPETAGRLPPRLPARPVPIPVLADPALDSILAPALEAVRR